MHFSYVSCFLHFQACFHHSFRRRHVTRCEFIHSLVIYPPQFSNTVLTNLISYTFHIPYCIISLAPFISDTAYQFSIQRDFRILSASIAVSSLTSFALSSLMTMRYLKGCDFLFVFLSSSRISNCV
jgi:hypothetical protein